MDQPAPQEININARPEIMAGSYANVMRVGHTREEFMLEFINLHPPAGELSAKVITTPGHMKRILAALAENIARYESQFGQISAAQEPAPELGFKG